MTQQETTSTEDRVRERAYRLWQDAGSPEGDADRYWHLAARQIEAEGGDGVADDRAVESGAAQSDKQQRDTAVPEESPMGDGETLSEPRAKRREG